MIEGALRFIALVWEAFRRALVLDEQLLVAVEAAPEGAATWIVATIVFLAGIAQILGQSVVLFINRVRPRRFVLSLLLNGLLFLSGLFVWAIVIWLGGRLFGLTPPFITVVRMIGLGSAPLIFSVFVLVPFAGPFLGRIFSVWSFLITLGMLRFTYQTDLTTALVIVGAGWLAMILLNALIGRPIRSLRQRLFRRVSGAALDTTAHDLLATLPNAEVRTLPDT